MQVPQQIQYVITLSCPDKGGLLRAVPRYLYSVGCSIEESQQYKDIDTGFVFIRMRVCAEQTLERLSEGLANVVDGFSFPTEWQIHPVDQKLRVLIMVSKFGHCLNDLLFRASINELPIEIAAVVSNHRDLEELVGSYKIPFHHIPVTKDTKPEAEARLLALIESEDIQLMVLARYMQILSDDLSKRLPGRIINIHHSLLPSFKGARPYHQAHARGVKLIGATAHYVTADLDEGPIIEQDIIRAGHWHTPEQLVTVGREVESRVLGRALKWHSEHRVLLNGRRTVVFA
ncbi:formyltetrahydrofolate deformylase [Streptomyces botrytidirepellens]|uniref:Formyltetrahydrofolate deformylase n=1 Tax=Streptomyces botrytidirepellens TaxID=2486417 RepID=A0A3M8UJE2_9ACTN|nr:formyltetrahydrofolate deformylase [Streptomyces botrytidirepellens]RNG04305.1 formyltetrahydrofolate deformylase [Streptomyces botrytidirepellens]